MTDLAERLVPHLDVVSTSQPEPTPGRHNVVAIVPDVEHARAAVLALESMEDDDARVGLVVMGARPRDDVAGIDPEGVTGSVAPRIVLGALAGAVVGALVVGGATALLADDSAVAGPAIGGAFLFGVFGAIWAVFARLGGSDAYRQTFVEPRTDAVALVSLHTDDRDAAAAGFERLRGAGPYTVMEYDASLRTEVRRVDGSTH
jgi:hypothetical protein